MIMIFLISHDLPARSSIKLTYFLLKKIQHDVEMEFNLTITIKKNKFINFYTIFFFKNDNNMSHGSVHNILAIKLSSIIIAVSLPTIYLMHFGTVWQMQT